MLKLKLKCNFEEKDYLLLMKNEEICEEEEIEISVFEFSESRISSIYLNKEKSMELAKKLIEFAKGE